MVALWATIRASNCILSVGREEADALLENPRWERFCQLYAVDGNASAAYRGAGYHPKTDGACWAAACRLLRDVKIQQRIEELTEEARQLAEASAIADIREIRATMTAILRGEIDKTLPSDRIKAGDFLARLGGRVEPPTVKLELSLSEKRARIREMIYDSDSDSDED